MDRKYAGFLIRLIAYLLDGIIISVISNLVIYIYSLSGENTVSLIFEGPFNLFQLDNDFESITFLIVVILNMIVLPATKLQGSLGKAICQLKIINQNGERLTLLRSIGRFFAEILSVLILCIGFLIILMTKHKQALHDVLANTYVSYRTKIDNKSRSYGKLTEDTYLY